MLQEKILSKLIGFDIAKIQVSGNSIRLHVKLRKDDNAQIQEELIKKLLPDYEVSILFFVKDEGKKPFKKIIGVCSGKGGVGKSTVSLHLAFALKEMGFKVGILDADIYAPSIPVFLNVHENPISVDGRLIEPVKTHGFSVLSMGLFLQENQSAMWRGPMLAAAFTQFLEQGNWDCDYLIIDFPPGTSDIHMSCARVAPDIEMLLVGMPDKVVYADVRRMYVVLRALNLKVVGLVENIAYSVCQQCGHKESWQSAGEVTEIKKIASLPLFHHFHALNESGYPPDYKSGEERLLFKQLAERAVMQTTEESK